MQHHAIAFPRLEQRLGDWRDPRHAAVRRIDFVDADDADLFFFILHFYPYGGAEEHVVGSAPLQIRPPRRFQPLDEKADAAVDLAQSPLAVDVVGVLGAIAERGRPGHRLHYLGALGLRQLLELGLQARVAFWRNVILAARNRWRLAFFLLRGAFVLDKSLRHGGLGDSTLASVAPSFQNP